MLNTWNEIKANAKYLEGFEIIISFFLLYMRILCFSGPNRVCGSGDANTLQENGRGNQ